MHFPASSRICASPGTIRATDTHTLEINIAYHKNPVTQALSIYFWYLGQQDLGLEPNAFWEAGT